ncbi:phosphoribosylaminoimidazolesuccinocarboxamide synthase [filamentous cyanobacterium LEGE 11480]|uniref:Phosphoribosylaminoimidazole-succinocarboxamide synthase n=1 Tax=Romeriopsis navalis LEGE 11480 TaxID=2777977 RepID=A0A928Z2L8_9CYAN|nr:phosphoribosylaminoimidazolesuccinocarboxamide synthase [Romeriopsis navalis]MBE9028263.1 phosphoribosylaminoimidazolesuccinocarboxamide synthase [Romeriopsis navalis LEGE 11480]
MSGEKLYEGKAKVLYTTDDPDVLLTRFKDDATAFNAQKRGTIRGKGEINNAISAHLFKLMAIKGIPTHFVDLPTPTDMLVKAVTIVPLEVVVRNIAAGSLCKQTGIPLGREIKPPIVEFYLKDDNLGDPLLTLDRIRLLDVSTPAQVEQLSAMALQINHVLCEFFDQCGITLVDFKLEFGVDRQGNLILADEISPDTCRFWQQGEPDPQKRVLDKDRFRQDLGNVEGAYQQVLEKVLKQAI